MVEAPEPPHHHQHPTGLPWFDFIVPIAVLCISVASLITSLESEKSMHALVEQNTRLVSAQSTPLLMLDTANQSSNKPILSMTLSNVGTGPARIDWFHVVDDRGVSYSGAALTNRVAALDSTAEVLSQQVSGTFIRSGDSRDIYSWPRPSTPAALEAWKTLNQTRFHLHASACYCSMFNECRTTTFDESLPKLVPACKESDSR